MRTYAGMRQHLVFDADDTLWENNVYFERSIAEFVTILDHSTLTPEEVRAVLDEVEHAQIGAHGYGAAGFALSLAEAYRRLSERPPSEPEVAVVRALGERILGQEKELLPGVPETLAALATRHDLTVVTKGNLEEQRLKVERSGLAGHFRHVEIVPEKDEATYRRLAGDHGWDPGRTWMIGNSPKSDINPALAAGLNAVFIPHPDTWRMEAADLQPPAEPERLIVLERFAQLLDQF